MERIIEKENSDSTTSTRTVSKYTFKTITSNDDSSSDDVTKSTHKLKKNMRHKYKRIHTTKKRTETRKRKASTDDDDTSSIDSFIAQKENSVPKDSPNI